MSIVLILTSNATHMRVLCHNVGNHACRHICVQGNQIHFIKNLCSPIYKNPFIAQKLENCLLKFFWVYLNMAHGYQT